MASTAVLETLTCSASPNPPGVELRLVQETPSAVPNASVESVSNSDLILNKNNIIKILSIGLSYIFAGLNDGSLGPLTPYILSTFHVGTGMVALM